jgi:hypothetical protein
MPKWKRQVASWTRWLHIYVSMLAFTVVLFFAVTGLTLNHSDWFFANHEDRVTADGVMNREWVRPGGHFQESSGEREDSSNSEQNDSVDKLQVVEYLRSAHAIRGALSEFLIDEAHCTVVFKGPGYAADAIVERDTGAYDMTIVQHGLVAVLNDLHKGRDSGSAWSWVIDISAILIVVISLTGLVLLFYLKSRRAPGLILAFVGTVVVVLIFRFAVP